MWQDPNAEKFYKQLIELFKARYPNVEVEFITAPAGEYVDKLNVMLAGGDPADVYLAGVGFPYTYEAVQANTFADLTDTYTNELKGQLLRVGDDGVDGERQVVRNSYGGGSAGKPLL